MEFFFVSLLCPSLVSELRANRKIKRANHKVNGSDKSDLYRPRLEPAPFCMTNPEPTLFYRVIILSDSLSVTVKLAALMKI